MRPFLALGDADDPYTGLRLVPPVDADQQHGDVFDKSRVAQGARVDAATAGQQAGELDHARAAVVVAATDQHVAIEWPVDLEQFVGAIAYDYDVKSEQPARDVDLFELKGATKIRDVETQYGIALPGDGGFETLAGFLLMRFGKIPAAGESLEYEGRRFTVLEMDRNRIAKVRVEKTA